MFPRRYLLVPTCHPFAVAHPFAMARRPFVVPMVTPGGVLLRAMFLSALMVAPLYLLSRRHASWAEYQHAALGLHRRPTDDEIEAQIASLRALKEGRGDGAVSDAAVAPPAPMMMPLYVPPRYMAPMPPHAMFMHPPTDAELDARIESLRWFKTMKNQRAADQQQQQPKELAN
jgi:hypothetical protein